jgi:hypothetical protein
MKNHEALAKAEVPQAERAFRRGLSTIQKRVKVRGLGAISSKTAVGRNLRSWRNDLFEALDGEKAVSPQERTIVETVTCVKALHDHCAAFILQQSSLVNKSKRTVYPVVHTYVTLADTLVRHLKELGLERRAKPVLNLDAAKLERARKSLQEIMEEPDDEHEESTERGSTS